MTRAYLPDRRINGISRHQQAVLFRRNAPGFFCVSRPLKSSCLQTFINQQESILLPYQPFHLMVAGTAEEKQISRLKRIQGKLLFDKSRQPVNSFTQICFSYENVNMFTMYLHSFHRGRSSYLTRLMFPDSQSCTSFMPSLPYILSRKKQCHI